VRALLPRFALCCAICLAFLGPAISQESEASASSVDQLFAEPQADIVTQSSDAQQLLKPFHAQPLTVTGSFASMAGFVGGYTDGKDPDGSYNGTYYFKATPGLSFVPTLTFSARPDQTIRFQGTVSFPFASADMFSPSINEMFFDYTFQDQVFLRIGRHLVSWGVTRIFSAGGDLMEKSSEGLDLKVTVPIGSGGVTGIMLAPSSIMTDQFLWGDLTYGLQGTLPIGKTEFILSGIYYGNDSEKTPLRATAALKTSIFGIDLFAEGIGASTLTQRPMISASPILSGIVSGFFWERIDPELKLYGEYYYDASDTSEKSRFVSAVIGMDRMFGSPFNFGLQWTHAFLDGSGIIMPGFSINLWPHIALQMGFPCRYGDPGSYYLVNQSPSVQTSVVPVSAFHWYQRYGFLLRLNLSTGF
jgi:hypothetical protein